MMSAINGDKSRFNRVRKQKIAQRNRVRELLKRLAEAPKQATPTADSKPKAVSA
jgi:hypothetical protein